MFAKKTKLIISASVVLLCLAMLVITGCAKKAEPVTSPKSPETAAPSEPAAKTADVIEQKTCPVMGGEINKELYTEYKGQKVYFCCAGCKEKFEANPEKYLDKLLQFTN